MKNQTVGGDRLSPIVVCFLKHRSEAGGGRGRREELAVSLGKAERCVPGASIGVGTSGET